MSKHSKLASLEDAFVKVSFADDTKDGASDVYSKWIENSSAQHSYPTVFGADLLRSLYPKHSLVGSVDYNLNILSYPGALVIPTKPDELVTNTVFIPLGRRFGSIPGILAQTVEFGCFTVAWDKYEFLLYVVKFPEGFGVKTQNFVLHEGDEAPARALLMAVGAWAVELHEEIWVFNQGFWQKDHNLWLEIQKASWDDVILDSDFKKRMQKDVYTFFDSEEIYKELAIPWKRGLIFYGPPGNGKTISLKTIMKTVQDRGHSPLYVKSFQSWMGEEGAMQEVFKKARSLAPCVIILEDLDSLINDRNRSFFLNQLDGIESNDGLLVIGTTNHFDRLDPGLSTRPSRFDRKYLFNDPSKDERVLYAKFWQKKLLNNDNIEFPDSLITEVADLTYGFSFAYLKEVFVSALVLLATGEIKDTFANALKTQIKELRKQLDRPTLNNLNSSPRFLDSITPPPKPDLWEVNRASMALAVAKLGRSFIY